MCALSLNHPVVAGFNAAGPVFTVGYVHAQISPISGLSVQWSGRRSKERYDKLDDDHSPKMKWSRVIVKMALHDVMPINAKGGIKMKAGTLDLREAIMDSAIAIAERSNWEAVRLFDVAAELGITLDDIRENFREKEDVVDAWFDRADSHMLKTAETAGFLLLPPRERLQRLIMAWLDALAVHRKVTRQMIGAKLEPGHLHIQIPAIMRVSRTVQWVREAAQRDAVFLRRALEETALTTIYLATFAYWMQDGSENSQNTHDFLAHKLKYAESLDHMVYGVPRNESEIHSPAEPQSTSEITVISESSPLVTSVTLEKHVKSV
ncbi:MAG: TetR/AcrR family transcriptional regulator [Nitrosomonas sp.]|nr:MAG: TetR/AcrR family transcriptional regulator [Nitrosomonas sp.]